MTGDFSELKIRPFRSEYLRPNVEQHLYPGRVGEIVLPDGEEMTGAAAMWRLMPPWFKADMKEFARKFGGCNNARSEGIATSGMFKAVLKNRCLIPVSAIYEYAKDPGTDGKKVEYEFTPADGKPKWVAGLFSRANPVDGPILTYAMVMTNAGPDALSIGHPRSPIFLPDERLADWLDVTTDIESFAVSPPAGFFTLAPAKKAA